MYNTRIVMCIEYDGTNYYGWQIQKNNLSIQKVIENVLLIIFNKNIRIYSASRTDSGVHAFYQIAHFDLLYKKSLNKLLFSINSLLPNDISIKWINYVNNNFHSRFSAISRYYRYIIYNDENKFSILNKNIYFIKNKLNINKMIESSKILIGYHNFKTFCNVNNKIINYNRKIYNINIFSIYKKYIIFDIIANSFLYKMICNIIGCLIEIGLENKNIFWLKNILNKKNRNCFYKSVKSKGLYLMSINYPKKFNLPKVKKNNIFQIFKKNNLLNE